MANLAAVDSNYLRYFQGRKNVETNPKLLHPVWLEDGTLLMSILLQALKKVKARAPFVLQDPKNFSHSLSILYRVH